MGPLAQYQQSVRDGLLDEDAEQLDVIHILDAIAVSLHARKPWRAPATSLFSRLFGNTDATTQGVEGLYLWGGVGRGKTHLCDLFFASLAFEDKTRLHFHRFMQRIHQDLRVLGEVENPMPLIADKWAAKSRLLLLDEIHVHDITDAMLLGLLLGELFKRGVTLVTTSNLTPDDLYKDGLQRERFLPAIEQIKLHTNVVEMTGHTDYRLRLLQTEAIYLVSPLVNGGCNTDTQQHMQSHFDRLRVGEVDAAKTILINGWQLPIRARAGDLIWFEFETLCNTPRSISDYIEIATSFHTVMLSDVPVLDENNNDAARRLVNLVDEFYDRNVKLIVSAEALPEQLYRGKLLNFEFVRAASRLNEMQTVAYLSAERAQL